MLENDEKCLELAVPRLEEFASKAVEGLVAQSNEEPHGKVLQDETRQAVTSEGDIASRGPGAGTNSLQLRLRLKDEAAPNKEQETGSSVAFDEEAGIEHDIRVVCKTLGCWIKLSRNTSAVIDIHSKDLLSSPNAPERSVLITKN